MNNNKMIYTIQRPKPSAVMWLLGVVLAFGFGYLFLAAKTAFEQVMDAWQAGFGAALIELGMVMAAISLTRGKNWLAGLELAISLAVSGTYNYIQVQVAGGIAGISNWWQLTSLALGPLVALMSVALVMGKMINEYEEGVEAWEVGKQMWMEKEQKRLERRADRQAIKKMEIDARAGKLPEKYRNGKGVPEATAERPVVFADLPEVPRWDGLKPHHKEALVGKKGAEIHAIFPALSERTCRNWARAANVLTVENSRLTKEVGE